jgi:hypothetical protein
MSPTTRMYHWGSTARRMRKLWMPRSIRLDFWRLLGALGWTSKR